MSDIVLNSFQEYVNKAIDVKEIKTSGDKLNNNVLVDINIQLCTRVSLPIALSLSLSDKTAEINSILNYLRNEIVKRELKNIHISDMTVCDLLRWNYISENHRTNCSEYNPVYGICSQEYKFPRY